MESAVTLVTQNMFNFLCWELGAGSWELSSYSLVK
jgi:hypothetical protein